MVCQSKLGLYDRSVLVSQLTNQPNANDIKRKNANFAARAQAGKRTVKPARADKRSTGLTVLIFLGFLLIGGSEF